MENNSTNEISDPTKPIRIYKFLILVSCEIPSILCSLMIFYYFIRLTELRAKLHNHMYKKIASLTKNITCCFFLTF